MPDAPSNEVVMKKEEAKQDEKQVDVEIDENFMKDVIGDLGLEMDD